MPSLLTQSLRDNEKRPLKIIENNGVVKYKEIENDGVIKFIKKKEEINEQEQN